MGNMRQPFLQGLTAGFREGGDPDVQRRRWRARAVGYGLMAVGLVLLFIGAPAWLGVTVFVVGLIAMLYLRARVGMLKAERRQDVQRGRN